jgi:5'-nucleotidase
MFCSSRQSTLGSPVANALRESVRATPPGADFGAVNPGGLRAELLYTGSTGNGADVNGDGVITYDEANTAIVAVTLRPLGA